MNPSCGCGNNDANNPTGVSWEDEVDNAFILQIVKEVTQSCALPFSVPVDRIPSYILQAAMWFWQNDDWSCEERMYAIPNSEIRREQCKGAELNKVVQLPPQITSVWGVYKIQTAMSYGAMGDFSLERMMMSSYAMYGGVGAIGGGSVGSTMGYALSDVVTAMYEIDTFDQTLNPPLTYNYNQFSNKLVLLGDLKNSDILIQTFNRLKIQDLYKNYYFFRFVVCLVKRSLSTIYGSWEFKYPGGVTINYSNFSDEANTELDEIKEAIKRTQGCSVILQPNTL